MAENEYEGETSDVDESEQRDDSEIDGEAAEEASKECPEQVISRKPSKKSKVKKRRKRWLGINLSNCKYDSVRRVGKRFGMKEVGEDEDWSLFWTDYSVALERCMDMKRYQKINHFPGMIEICRKDLLARNMNRLLKLYPKEYQVFPKTWVLPADYSDFQAFCRQKKNKSFICKPESGSQGKGIFVTKNPKDIKPGEHMICQQYLAKPFLIDGFKFDLRIYIMISSCDPLRIFVYKDGLARFATVQYSEPSNSNMEDMCMHLTNYAINKHSKDFDRDEESGSKRRITTVDTWFRNHGYDIDKIWADIEDVMIKTLISAHPILKHNYRTCFPNHNKGSACFEILGFDILLDRKLKPWVLEVNHSPSFHTDSKLDKEVKEGLIYDTLNLVNFNACDKKKCLEEDRKKVQERLLNKQKQPKDVKREDNFDNLNQQMDLLTRYEDTHLGGFRRVYPNGNEEKYEKYFENSGSLFQETTASKARTECSRIQRELILAKKQEIEVMRAKNSGRKLLQRDGLRPESAATIKKTKRMTGKKIACKHEPIEWQANGVDTGKPIDITEEEELERITGMLQRDNLVRGLGIVEEVYKLLHCTPGTGGPKKDCVHHSHQSKDSSQSKVKTQESDDRRYHSIQNNIISNPGSVVSSYLASSSIGRLYPHAFPQHTGLSRAEYRRTFATIGHNDSSGHLSPGTHQSNNGNKHRYGTRKILTNRNAYYASDNDTRFSDCDATSLESHYNPHLRRTLSANGLACKLQANSGKIRTGNTSSIVPPGVISLQNTSSHGVKVTAHKSPLGLSVISGPAPISYKSLAKSGGHSGNLGRTGKLGQRIRSTSSDPSCKHLEVRDNHTAVVLS
ncbi:tubulin polyglutamylase ttll6-like [Dendronephthya gigantea]|uniref:tubulin polyglutamylase ttll6-like n=1 Tax=Dendronephthya gigantea TaxID=151771 RepID=UPI00106A3586|nr:tubulin polyglutamylase ttll6-like [Dendronephthya gigantea]